MDSIDILTKKLQANDLPTQISAAESLAGLAEAAQPAIVALVQHCGAADKDLHNWCHAALEAIGPPTAKQIDELALLASSANRDTAFWAATLLGRAGAIAGPATPVLEERSSDGSAPEVQKRAIWALQQIQAA